MCDYVGMDSSQLVKGEDVSATPDYRTEAQKDRDARGMVLFNGQEISREAYARIQGVSLKPCAVCGGLGWVQVQPNDPYPCKYCLGTGWEQARQVLNNAKESR